MTVLSVSESTFGMSVSVCSTLYDVCMCHVEKETTVLSVRARFAWVWVCVLLSGWCDVCMCHVEKATTVLSVREGFAWVFCVGARFAWVWVCVLLYVCMCHVKRETTVLSLKARWAWVWALFYSTIRYMHVPCRERDDCAQRESTFGMTFVKLCADACTYFRLIQLNSGSAGVFSWHFGTFALESQRVAEQNSWLPLRGGRTCIISWFS